MLNGEAVFSCLTPLLLAADKEVVTVEGLGTEQSRGAMQRAFIEEQAAQCGYCIAGMMMRAQALLKKNFNPTDADIRTAMEPNLCRCGTHMRIMRAIKRAATLMRTADAGTSTGALR
jgi:nicotinate dehydrogenase subunit A